MEPMVTYDENKRILFSQRLNKALDDEGFPKERGRAQRVKERLPFSISVNGIKKWLSGDAIPSTTRLSAVADIANVTPEWLLSGNVWAEWSVGSPPPDEYVVNTTQGPDIQGRVPLISMVQAGNFCESIDLLQPGDAEEWIACPANHSDQSYALRVQGESMLPRFTEGEIIIVDPNVSPDAGKFVIAKRANDQKTTFKQLMKDDEDYYLKALNPDWGDRYIRMSEDWHVCGVVICKIDML